MMTPSARPSLASLWLHWVLANATVAGTVHALVVMAIKWESDNPGASSLVMLTMIPGTLGLLFLMGYPQQFVLRSWVAYVDYWALMMPANMLLGSLFSVVLLIMLTVLQVIAQDFLGSRQFTLPDEVMFPLAALAFGVGFSLLQLPYLCLTRRGGWLWLVANAVGVTLALFTELLIAEIVFEPKVPRFSSLGGSDLLGTIAGAVYGVITGAALVMLMRGHARYPVRIGGYGPAQRA
jgi:hypothetical protein